MTDTRAAHKQLEEKHFAGCSKKEFIGFMKVFDILDWSITTKLAIKLLILTFVKNKEVRGARWNELDFEKNEWCIPAGRMKIDSFMYLSSINCRRYE